MYCLICTEWQDCDLVHLGTVVDSEEVVAGIVDCRSAEDDTVFQLETVNVADFIGVQSPQVHETVFGS